MIMVLVQDIIGTISKLLVRGALRLGVLTGVVRVGDGDEKLVS